MPRLFSPFAVVISLLSLFLATPFLSVGQDINTIIIEGKSLIADAEEVRLIIIDDLLSFTPKTVATSKIEKDGTFELEYKTNHICLAQLVLNTSKAEFLLVPGHRYSFTIDMDPQLFPLLDPGKYGGFLQVKNNTLDTADLNFKINRFTHFFELLLNDYAFPITYYGDKTALDSVHAIVKSRFPVTYNPENFYLSYIFYSLAPFDKIVYNKYPDSLYHLYFDNEYILYDNPAYMAAFKAFYDNFLYNSKFISKAVLNDCINLNPNYSVLFNEAGKDPSLVNERIRELALIHNLSIFIDNEEFDSYHILSLLNYIKDNTHFTEHRLIAENVINKVTMAAESQLLSEVVFTNEKGKKTPLSKFSGKWVYIQLFQSNCLDCIREMLIINELNEKYKDNIEFISLNLDFNKEKFFQFIKDYPQFDWTFLYFNHQYDWLMQYGIETLPDNLLLDSNGALLLRDAPTISKDLPLFLNQHFPEEEVDDQNPLFLPRN